MKKVTKYLTILLIISLVAVQSIAACTIFAVGKDASVDGSTMTSHSCDSTGDDPRVWLIPSMPAGTVRDIVVNGRAGGDYSQFPEVKNYGYNSMVLGEVTYDKPTNQYVHSMYSFINDKGLAMGESTCGFSNNFPHSKKIRDAWSRDEGILDCYCLQDMALENCSTAREAVEYMGAMLDEYGWYGAAECINICDGNEAWIFEAYGGHMWCAIRVPSDSVFVAANRCRIDVFYENDPDNFRYAATMKQYALDNGLWDGKSEFQPCEVFAPSRSLGCVLREWRAMSLLDSDLNLDPYANPNDWPLFVVPDEKVSVDDIWRLHQDYYAGTEFDISDDVEAGPFGNVVAPRYVNRPINMYNSTYVQISNIRADLPAEARALVWFGWGAASTQYLTPVFASAKSLPEHFGIAERKAPYDENSGWAVTAGVQQIIATNYNAAMEVVRSVRDPKMDSVYKTTASMQDLAASMINVGMKDEALDLLTNYTATVANDWHDTYLDLDDQLRGMLMLGRVNMKAPELPDWWKDVVSTVGTQYTRDDV